VPSFLTSIAGSGEALYLADQYSQPYLLKWDTVWCLIVNAGNSGGATTWETDFDGYCSARAAEGFNGFLTTPVATSSLPGPYTNGNTWDNVAPFSSPGVLNNTFWTRVDYLLNSAETSGLTVVLNVMFTYSLYTSGGPLNGWTNTQYQNYGAAVGARYASQPNLVWELGDDYGGSWLGGLNYYDTQFSAFLTGLRGAGANQLVSVENESDGSSRYSDDGGASFAWGIANAQFNWCYGYNCAYNAVEDAYTEAAVHSKTPLCNVRMDGWYDNQGAALSESIELFGRKSFWWALSSGSRGYMYGNGNLFAWPSGTLASGICSSSPGSGYMQPGAMNTIWTTFASFPGWHLLVPDTSSALVTAGRGTRASEFGAGAASPGTQYTGGNTYVTASINPAGTLAVIYIPSAVTITVNGSLMASGYTATWVDPASGAQTAATIASTYSHSAANSAGDHDWVLVLAVPSSYNSGPNYGSAEATGTGAGTWANPAYAEGAPNAQYATWAVP
jgi:hypothetical protein